MLSSDNGGPWSSSRVGVWNNIIRTNGSPGYWLDIYRPRLVEFESDRNVFWSSGDSVGYFVLDFNPMRIDAWRSATGQDRTSYLADPLFVSDPTNDDYFTQNQSIARDRALVFSGARFCGLGPDIGFRESGC